VIYEHALLQVFPDKVEEFKAAMIQALPIIRSHEACRGATVQQQIEDASVFLLLVQWDSVEGHTEGFRKSELFERWRALTHPFYPTKPEVTHFASKTIDT
jgi:quinol monooxygenase YgiN